MKSSKEINFQTITNRLMIDSVSTHKIDCSILFSFLCLWRIWFQFRISSSKSQYRSIWMISFPQSFKNAFHHRLECLERQDSVHFVINKYQHSKWLCELEVSVLLRHFFEVKQKYETKHNLQSFCIFNHLWHLFGNCFNRILKVMFII